LDAFGGHNMAVFKLCHFFDLQLNDLETGNKRGI